MRRRTGRRLVAAMLLLAMNSYTSASIPVGTLYATGHVEVDGTYVPQTMIVSDGQNVRTTPSAKAVLQIPKSQSSVMAFENTSLKVNNIRLLTLTEGGVSVETSQQARTNIGPCAWVMPWDRQPTTYEIRINGNIALVHAYKRPVTLRNDFQAIEIHPNMVGVVEDYGTEKCRVAFYQQPYEWPVALKALMVGSYGTAASVPFWFQKQELSAQAP